MRRLTKILLVTTICSSFVFGSSAQEESSQENKWGGDAALGFALARGNTNTTSFSLTLSAKGPISKSVINSNKAFFMLNREKEITNAESMGLESQINWQLTERFFSYYKILGIRDKFKNFRILPSVGIGYKVVATEKVQFSASTGLSEVFTKYYGSGDTDSYTGIALGNQLIWKISESAELSQTLDLNSDVSELSHYFLRFEMSLATAIAKGLSVKLTFMDNFDNKPVGEGIKKNDVSILAGLSAKF
jgi:putative salt-induced outer membrane protein YdiY